MSVNFFTLIMINNYSKYQYALTVICRGINKSLILLVLSNIFFFEFKIFTQMDVH